MDYAKSGINHGEDDGICWNDEKIAERHRIKNGGPEPSETE